MAYLRASLLAIQSMLLATGRFPGGVTIGRPPGPPNTLAAAVFITAGSFGKHTSSSTIRSREVTIRIYADPLAEPMDEVDAELEAAVYDTEQNILDDLDLSATGWSLSGTEAPEAFDYVELGNDVFRVADIPLELLYGE